MSGHAFATIAFKLLREERLDRIDRSVIPKQPLQSNPQWIQGKTDAYKIPKGGDAGSGHEIMATGR